MNRPIAAMLACCFLIAAGTVCGQPRIESNEVFDHSFGVKGDDRTDDRVALQTAIDASVGKTLVITGHTRIDTQGLTLRSGSRILFAPGASIRLLPHDSANYQMLRIWDVQHVEIVGANLDGANDLSSAQKDPLAHGYGMDISIAGASDVRLVNPVTNNCWGDGIYIAGSYDKSRAPYSENVTIIGHHADGCRRQGVSLISGRNIHFVDPVWEHISGTLPSAGLDAEPNSNDDVLDQIRIDNPTTVRCKVGILVWLKEIAGKRPVVVDIVVNHHTDIDSEQGSFSVSGLDTSKGAVTGRIASIAPDWTTRLANPYVHRHYDNDGPRVEITEQKITKAK